MPGRFLTGSSPSSTVICSAPYAASGFCCFLSLVILSQFRVKLLLGLIIKLLLNRLNLFSAEGSFGTAVHHAVSVACLVLAEFGLVLVFVQKLHLLHQIPPDIPD